MKKIILLVTILFYFNPTISFAKTLICSHIWYDELKTFERDLTKLEDNNLLKEDEENIIFLSLFNDAIYILVYNKKNNKFVSNFISTREGDNLKGAEGTCRLIN